MFTSLMLLTVAARLECVHAEQAAICQQNQMQIAAEQRAAQAAASYIQVYDVRDIEFIVRKYDSVPQMTLDGSDQNTPAENHAIRGKSAIQILKLFVAPTKWDTDPMNYSISYWEGLVIVRAPKSVHALIR